MGLPWKLSAWRVRRFSLRVSRTYHARGSNLRSSLQAHLARQNVGDFVLRAECTYQRSVSSEAVGGRIEYEKFQFLFLIRRNFD